jgi:S-adenosylmethionine hydrolase
MNARYDTISFFSDYGRTDEFVGVVHSVIASIAPEVRIIDLSHDIAPHDVRAGGLLLARSAQYLRPGVVLGVVDPGVGSARRGVAIEVGGGQSVLVGPDNGLFAAAVAMVGGATRTVELTSDDHRLPAPGATFDGRDVFGPAAAHLCAGVDLGDLGPEVDPQTLIPGMLPVLREDDGVMTAEVLWVDRFGNAQLNLDPEDLAGHGEWFRMRIGEDSRRVRVVTSYSELDLGEIGLVIDSYGLLALSVAQGSAAFELGLSGATEVALEPADAPRGPSSMVELRPRTEMP